MSMIATSYLSHFTNRKSYSKQLKAELISLLNLTEKIVNSSECDDESTFLRLDKANLLSENKVSNQEDLYFYMCQDLYARVNSFVSVMTKQIQKKQSKTVNKLKTRGIITPTCQSLPSSCNNLYKAFETLMERNNIKPAETTTDMVSKIDVTMSSKSAQTENCDLQYCESCHVSTELVKSLVHTILSEQKKYSLKTTHVSSFREKLRYELSNMSQWAAMTGWASAIQQDIERATEKIYTTHKENVALLYKTDQQKKSFENAEKALKNDLELITKKLQAEQAQCTYQKHQIEDLQNSLDRSITASRTCEKTIRTQRTKIETLRKCIVNIKSSSENLRQSYKKLCATVNTNVLALEKSFKCIQSETVTLIKEAEHSIQLKLHQEKLKTSLMEKTADQNDYLVKQTKLKNLELENENHTLKERIEQIEKELDRAQIQQTKYVQKIDSLEETVVELKARTTHRSKPALDFEPQLNRNPVKDMELQRQHNKKQIRRLIRENEELKSTINKMKLKKTYNSNND